MKKLCFLLFLFCFFISCTSYHTIDVDSDLTYRVVPATLNLLQKEFPSKDFGTVVELDCAKGESESCQIVFLQLDKIAGKTGIEYKLVQTPLVSESGNELTETEMLSFIYEDIYNIQRELITVLSAINIKNK